MVKKSMKGGADTGAIYGIGLIGAIVYYLQQSNTLSEAFIGFLKSLVWPAFVVYKLHEFLQL